VTEGERPDIEWAGHARRALERLPEKVGTAAIDFIYGPLAEEPHRLGRPLRFELEGLHSARRGDHRIIYRIDEDMGRVVVEVIQHRADTYRRR
jgi:mRNA-degrading endonuclease RelE of RelBE toxin-antitoxin system